MSLSHSHFFCLDFIENVQFKPCLKVSNLDTLRHGRTEAIRPVTSETREFCQALAEKAAEKSAEKARKVFTFALVGRDKTFFHPDVLENLAKGDGNANSKKDADIR